MLAEQLIAENLRTKNPILDLGRCGLDGTEPELYQPLQHANHLHTLIFSDYHKSFDTKEQLYVEVDTQNQVEKNLLQQIPPYLPQSLRKLTLSGDFGDDLFEETPAKIQDYTPLLALKNLIHLEVNNQENLDLEVIGQLTQLRVLTCFLQERLHKVHHLANLQQLEFLDVSSTNSQGIDFVQTLTQLQHFSGDVKSYEELEVIAQLKHLKTLRLGYNKTKITHIDCLAKLTNLLKLSLGFNEIQDISALCNLQHLKYLNLAFNRIDDLQGLENLTQLVDLSLASNCLKNEHLNSLKNLTRLKKLDLDSNEIDDLGALSHLTQLEVLHISVKENIRSFDFLTSLGQLKELYIGHTNIPSLEGFYPLQKLEKLYLDKNHLENIEPLAALTNLQELHLQHNNIEIAHPLKYLKNLRYLDISNNAIQDVDFLENLADLKTLIACDNKICSLKPLTKLKKLEKLQLDFNAARDIDALQGLTSLKHLSFMSAKLPNMDFVKNLTQLTFLCLGANNIQDISPLAHLPNLRVLFLGYNPIQDISPLKSLPKYLGFKFGIDHTKLPFPPIWYAYAQWAKKPFRDYAHLTELPQVEKIWQLMRTKEENNIRLAQALAKGQGWSEEDFKVYQKLLNKK
ncbi:MAG TPA: hypothetical protein DCS93_30125 [Microscillaceae bacterium]|nr:hypothetical protein [Microscillaceae bacterium]